MYNAFDLLPLLLPLLLLLLLLLLRSRLRQIVASCKGTYRQAKQQEDGFTE